MMSQPPYDNKRGCFLRTPSFVCRFLLFFSLSFQSNTFNAAQACSLGPVTGVFLDVLQATSSEALMVAQAHEFETGDIRTVTLDLSTGGVTEEGPPDSVTVYPAGLGAPLDYSQYSIDVGKNSSKPDEYIATVTDSTSQASIAIQLANLDIVPGEKPSVFWFVSSKLERTFAFYNENNGTITRPRAVITALPGGSAPLLYLDYPDSLEFFSTIYSDPEGRLPVYEEIQLALIPRNPCEFANLYYTDNSIELRTIDGGPLDLGGVATTPDRPMLVYKANHTEDTLATEPQGYFITIITVATDEREHVELNKDDILRIFEEDPNDDTSAATRLISLSTTCILLILGALFVNVN